MRANFCVPSASMADIGSAITVISTLPGPMALDRAKARREFPPADARRGLLRFSEVCRHGTEAIMDRWTSPCFYHGDLCRLLWPKQAACQDRRRANKP